LITKHNGYLTKYTKLLLRNKFKFCFCSDDFETSPNALLCSCMLLEYADSFMTTYSLSFENFKCNCSSKYLSKKYTSTAKYQTLWF